MNYMPIGVFDSGVGGLTVLKELRKELPYEDYIYIGDTKRLPYGTKSKEEVIKFSIEIFNYFKKLKVKAVVIACNTATAAALETVSKLYDFPVLGVIESGAIDAINSTRNKKVALMATDSTVNSGAYERELKEIDTSIELKSIGCRYLVTAIEDGHGSGYIGAKIASEYLEQLENFDYDTLILGCTHFPVVKWGIEDYFKIHKRAVNIVNPANSTALKLKEVLKNNNMCNSEKNNPKVKYFVTGDKKIFTEVAGKILEGIEKDIKVKEIIVDK